MLSHPLYLIIILLLLRFGAMLSFADPTNRPILCGNCWTVNLILLHGPASKGESHIGRKGFQFITTYVLRVLVVSWSCATGTVFFVVCNISSSNG